MPSQDNIEFLGARLEAPRAGGRGRQLVSFSGPAETNCRLAAAINLLASSGDFIAALGESRVFEVRFSSSSSVAASSSQSPRRASTQARTQARTQASEDDPLLFSPEILRLDQARGGGRCHWLQSLVPTTFSLRSCTNPRTFSTLRCALLSACVLPSPHVPLPPLAACASSPPSAQRHSASHACSSSRRCRSPGGLVLHNSRSPSYKNLAFYPAPPSFTIPPLFPTRTSLLHQRRCSLSRKRQTNLRRRTSFILYSFISLFISPNQSRARTGDQSQAPSFREASRLCCICEGAEEALEDLSSRH